MNLDDGALDRAVAAYRDKSGDWPIDPWDHPKSLREAVEAAILAFLDNG